MIDKQKSENQLRSLQIFLVQRFFVAMMFIYVTSQITGALYRNYFIKILTNVLQVGDIAKGKDALGSLVELLFVSFWNLFSRNLPSVLKNSFSSFLKNAFGNNIHVPGYISQYGDVMIRIYYAAVIVLIIVQLIITLLPYVLAGWWYCRDISAKMTELRRIDRERIKQEEKQRNLLFSDIVHDIKTPITTIVGYSRALNDGIITDSDKKQDYLNSIYAKSMRISDLITMLFEFIKLESTGFSLHLERLDLAELLRENVITLFTDFEDKGLELDFDIMEKACPAEVDRVQMSRVITNLLTNAIRYSKSGDKVFISMQIIEKDEKEYLISVADSGLEISREFAEHIFEPFSRSDEARQTTSGGSGLGLSIAHKVAQMHGGELILNLDYEEGYTKAFQILVPVPKEEVETVNTTSAKD